MGIHCLLLENRRLLNKFLAFGDFMEWRLEDVEAVIKDRVHNGLGAHISQDLEASLLLNESVSESQGSKFEGTTVSAPRVPASPMQQGHSTSKASTLALTASPRRS